MKLRVSMTLLLLALISAQGLAAEPLGRLFFTLEKRDTLDRQRALNALANQQVAEDPQFTVNGQIRRNTGKRTTWINGIPQNDDDGRGGVVAKPSKNGADHVTLEASDEPTTTVRVGETFNRGTHEVSSELGDGKIVVKRPTAK